MSLDHDSLGTIERDAGGFVAILERSLNHDQAKVWAMLTEPAQLAQWLAPGTIELVAGGAAKLAFEDSGTVIDSVVSAIDPPRLLEFSWSGPGEPLRPVRWALAAEPAGATRLTLTLRVPRDEDVARACAGWEAHVMMLIAALEGVPIRFPFQRFQETRAAYRERVAAPT